MKDEIKEIRKELGLTQEAFADALGVSFATVNRWENGHSQPSKLALLALQGLLLKHRTDVQRHEDKGRTTPRAENG